MRKVLLVDSEPSSVTEIALALTKSGFEVMTALGETVRESSPDAIVVRDSPPRLDGFALCREIYHRFALPVILLGNRPETQVYSQNPDWDYYMRLPISGAFDMVVTVDAPVTVEAIAAKVQDNRWFEDMKILKLINIFSGV